MAWLTSLRNALYCLWLVLSIYSLYLLAGVPLLFLLLVDRQRYRKIVDYFVQDLWTSMNVVMVKSLLGVEFYVSGDNFLPDESALVLLNHQTHLDWIFGSVSISLAGWPNDAMRNLKFIMKESIMKVPGLGWAVQMGNSIFLKRNWEEDQKRIWRMTQHYQRMYKDIPLANQTDAQHVQLLLFPEGTNMEPLSKTKSDAYADAHNLVKFKHVLHPRTAGFIYFIEELKKNNCLDAIYDLTMAYSVSTSDGVPPRNELEFLQGNSKINAVFLHVKRINPKKLPGDHEALGLWLQKAWLEKEKFLENYNNNKESISSLKLKNEIYHHVKMDQKLYYSIVVWFVTTWICSYGLTNYYFQLYTIIGTIIGILVSCSSIGGFHEIEAALEKHGAYSGS